MPESHPCPNCRTPQPEVPASGLCPHCGAQWETQPVGTTDATRTLSPAAAITPRHPGAATPTLAQPGIASWRAPPRIPNYRDLTYISGGGMGTVFRGVQCGVERVVAIKLINRSAIYDPQARVRFGNEMQALGRVKHEGVVQVYESGETDDTPFYAMEYVAGGTLAQRLGLRGGGLPTKEAARIIATVAEAVHAAHLEKVLHRDIKPGNILMTEDGTPKVADFGLAKLTDSEFQMTMTGSQLGTPPYMAPEQIRGELTDITARSDVYGLGATLYECLTGRPPFRGATPQQTQQLVLMADPAPLSRHRPDVPKELEAICLKCLAKDPTQRFATAQELADELRRWERGEPTLTQPPTRMQKGQRWAKRHRVKLATVGIVLATLALLAWAFQPPPPPPPEPTERELIERELAAGREVSLLKADGYPRDESWHGDEVKITDALGNDGARGFQSFGFSLLRLGHDPMTDSYELKADIRHERTLSNKEGMVGLFIGLHNVPASGPVVSSSRWLLFDFSEFWSEFELQNADGADNHCLEAIDMLAVGLQTEKGIEQGIMSASLKHHLFTPNNNSIKNPWRTISAVISPTGVDVFWGKDKNRKRAFTISAQSVVASVDTYNRLAAKPGRLAEIKYAATPWMARGAYGLYVYNSAIAFQNVTIRPIRPLAP